ncbi:hypothetical protein LX36DRAFT_618115 [Colletotrichum falcatum]|nr:hypothetical protein LX36DRAFT_618115 [Colletotrichum falcatum]
MGTRNTYILAPNLTTPPPPEGPIALGHILIDPLEFNPLNKGGEQHLKISTNEIYGSHKMDGFTATRKDLLAGKLGLWAKFLAAILAVDVRAGVNFERDDDTIYQFGCLETTYFNPTKDYLRSCMTVPAVRSYMRAAKFAQPVYMVTGIKVGREVAVQSSHKTGGGFSAAFGVGDPTSSGEGGPELELKKEKARGFGFTRGDDCVVALRLQKITYKKDQIKEITETRGATMQDGSGELREDIVPELELDDDAANEITPEDFEDEMEIANDDEVDCTWIVPVERVD